MASFIGTEEIEVGRWVLVVCNFLKFADVLEERTASVLRFEMLAEQANMRVARSSGTKY
jgi:hypothetical protein